MSALIVILAVFVATGAAVIALYNGLVRSQNLAREGWSGIDVQLKRRADLIPNLVDAVKGYMGHENTVLTKVTDMRAKTMQAPNLDEREKAEGQLANAVRVLLGVAESYPDLKASLNFQNLQKALSDTEEQLQYARRYYNAAARDLNVKIGSFPGNLVAALFRFREISYFQLDNPSDSNAPNVKLSP